MNICRPIILHNEFLPANTGERTWEYRAFGHYDGITVKDGICIERYENLKSLFDVCLQSEEDSFMYFSQTLLGFHSKTEEEEQFWEKKLPFLYIVLLQVSDVKVEAYQKYLESREFLEKELSCLGREDEIKSTFITAYYSLDNSDLITVIKCGYADTGAVLINSLHQDNGSESTVSILNSYSILGICQEEIITPDSFIEANKPIEEMELRVIEGDSNSIADLYRRLMVELEIEKNETTISVKTLLGTEDASIVIKNLSWKQLLPLYREKTGILNNSGKEAQKHACAISTKIMLPFDGCEKSDEHGNEEAANKRKIFCIWLNEKIDEVCLRQSGAGKPAEKKNLIMFAKSLFRFENACYIKKEFSDYNFFALYLPFYTFVELWGENNSDCPEDYYIFMERLKLRTQSFAKPDRVFSQIADFNMRYFDVPIKFITLYSAYIHYFKEVLNTKDDKNYQFLVCPGMNSEIGVVELFLKISNKNRLFFIEIPEQQMYNLKQTFIMIGHEMAHFVGTDVRCRSERKELMINLCSRIMILSMRNYLGCKDDFVKENMDDLNFDSVESKMREWIGFYTDREQKREYLKKHKYHQSITDSMVEKNLEFKKQYGEHSDVLRDTLVSSVKDVLLEHGQDIFGYIFHREFFEMEEDKGYEERDSFLAEKNEMIQECIYRFIYASNSKNHALTIENVIDKVLYLIKECYADMICILTLHLTLKDYLEALAESVEESNIPIEQLRDTIIPARIAIVMTVVGHSLEKDPEPKELLFHWTNEEFNYEADETVPIRELEKAGNIFVQNYILNEVILENMVGNSIEIIYDQKILREIIRFLLKCRKKYFEILISNKGNEIRKKENQYVHDIYSLSQTQESEDFFGKLMNMISYYEADVYAEMQEIISSEK